MFYINIIISKNLLFDLTTEALWISN